MQDDQERRPDLADENYEETAQRVDKLMQGSEEEPKFKTSKTKKPASPKTAPVIAGLPVPKEPLTIKILTEEQDSDENLSQENAKQKKEPDVSEKQDEPTDTDEPEDSASSELTEDSAEEDNLEVAEPEPVVERGSSVEDNDPLDDPKTEQAVNDIIAKEGDAVLEAEDEKIAKSLEPGKQTKMQKFKEAWKNYWADPKKRWLTICGITVLLLAAWVVPTSRYFMLNTAGARAKLSVRVIDQSTRQPLKNVRVSAGGTTVTSDEDGFARLAKVKLGPTSLNIERVAFATWHQNITVGWGSNPKGEVHLQPVGVQYSFTITDYLSGKPIEKVEAVSGEASAFSDDEGILKLTVDKPTGDTIDIILRGSGLREENIAIATDMVEPTSLQMVPSRKHVFVSNREGKLDVYSVYADGKQEQKILAASGSERDDLALLSHPTDELVAVVSTRDNKRNKDGFLLSALNIVNLQDNSAQKVTESERVQLVGWSGDRLVYVQVAAGTSAANPKRHRLLSHDFKNNQTDEIAAANYFNDVLMVAGKVYYAPTSTYQPNDSNSRLYRVDADGSNRQTILNRETWNIFRVAHEKLALSVGQEWYDLDMGTNQATKSAGAPANATSRIYIDSPDGNNSLWTDVRDGKGVLLSYQPSTKNELTLRQQSGLRTPVRWLSDSVVVFRISTEQETSDYALSLDGGDAKKISDVTNTSSTDNWYYY